MLSNKNTGSTTNNKIGCASMAAFTEGIVKSNGLNGQYSAFINSVSASTETELFSIRTSRLLNLIRTNIETVLRSLQATCDAQNVVIVRFYVNPTPPSAPEWTCADPTQSTVCTSSNAWVSGTPLFSRTLQKVDSVLIDLSEMDIQLGAGDVVSITVESADTTPSADATLLWKEEY